jgi:hypothetical protein
MNPISFPARPLSGGRFGLVTKRPVHLWSAKLNGWRVLAHSPTGTVWNRHGQELSIADEFNDALEILSALSALGIEWPDCEGLERRHNIGRGTLIILDAVLPGTATDRFARLLDVSSRAGIPLLDIGERPEENRVYLLRQHSMSDASPTGHSALVQRWQQMQALNAQWGAEFYEGLVAKRADSTYPVQLRDPDSKSPFWVKHRWAY